MFIRLLVAVSLLGAAMAVKDGGIMSGHYSVARMLLDEPKQSWTQESKIVAEDGAPGNTFGFSLAVSGDTMVVGSPGIDRYDGAGAGPGAAYVFIYDGQSWIQQAKLLAEDRETGDGFGEAVAISGDTVVVASSDDDDNGIVSSGSAYIFVRVGTSWTQEAKLTAEDATQNGSFGASVSISGDTAVIGSANAIRGATYVFVRNGTNWSQQAKLTAADRGDEDRDGFSVSIFGDTLVTGSPTHNGRVGAAYIFTRVDNAWSEEKKLTALDGAANDFFGWCVAIFSDTVAVGSPGHDGDGTIAGGGYVFVRDGSNWTQQAKLRTDDLEAGYFFGCPVSMSGNTIVVGSTDLYQEFFGAAFLFNLEGSTWNQKAKIDAAVNEEHGYLVSVSGETLFASSPSTGTVYAFPQALLVQTSSTTSFPTSSPTTECIEVVCFGSRRGYLMYREGKRGFLGRCRERCVIERLVNFHERLGWSCGTCEETE